MQFWKSKCALLNQACSNCGNTWSIRSDDILKDLQRLAHQGVVIDDEDIISMDVRPSSSKYMEERPSLSKYMEERPSSKAMDVRPSSSKDLLNVPKYDEIKKRKIEEEPSGSDIKKRLRTMCNQKC